MLLKCMKTVHTVDQFVNFNNNNVVGSLAIDKTF